MRFFLPENGQAATECVITATFVLVPLFLIIPLLGKYMDIKHAAINQARFEAWEYTAWFGPEESKKHILSDKPKTHSAGKKTWKQTREEGNLYFFSDPTSSAYGTGQQDFQLNPLWKDHRGDWLFHDGKNALPSSSLAEKDTPDPSPTGANLIDDLLNIFNWITKSFGDLLGAMGVNAQFDAIYTKGYFSSEVKMSVRPISAILPKFSLSDTSKQTEKPLIISSKASVLSNDWSAGSSSKAISESKGLVLTSLLNPISKTMNDVLDVLQEGFDVLAKYTPVKVGLPHMPDFGYVQEDLIPLEYLRDDKGNEVFKKIPVKAEHRLYYYEEK